MKFGRTADYGVVLSSSFDILRKNLILFFPNLMMLFVSLMLMTVFFYGSGLSEMIFTKPYLLEDTSALLNEFEQLSLTAPFIITLVAWIVGELLIGAFFAVMKFGMIRKVINDGQATLVDGIKFAEKNYLNYWVIHFASFMLIFGPLFVLLFVYFLFAGSLTHITYGAFVLGFFGVVWFVYAILMAIRLFFVFPVMTFEREKYFKSIRHEFHYVKTHLGHTFLSFLIVLAFIAGYNVIRETVEFFGITFHGGSVIMFIAVFMALFEVFVATWEHVFIFKSYLAGKHINNLVAKAKKKGDYVPKKKKASKTSPRKSTKKPKTKKTK